MKISQRFTTSVRKTQKVLAKKKKKTFNRYFPGVGVPRLDLAVICGKTQICVFVCLFTVALFPTFFVEGKDEAEKEEED